MAARPWCMWGTRAGQEGLGVLVPVLLVAAAVVFVGAQGAAAPEAAQLQERDALLALKSSLNNHPAFEGFDPNTRPGPPLQGVSFAPWTNGTLPGSTELNLPCVTAWAWITCNTNSRVESIDLSGPSLGRVNGSWSFPGGDPITGSVPWKALSALESLTLLEVSEQRVGGGLTGLGALPSLVTLSMGFNQLMGEVPSEVTTLQQLQTLFLPNNSLSGPLPPSIWTAPRLSTLDVTANFLNGTLPPQPTRLVTFSFAQNCLQSTASGAAVDNQRPPELCNIFYGRHPAPAPVNGPPAEFPPPNLPLPSPLLHPPPPLTPTPDLGPVPTPPNQASSPPAPSTAPPSPGQSGTPSQAPQTLVPPPTQPQGSTPLMPNPTEPTTPPQQSNPSPPESSSPSSPRPAPPGLTDNTSVPAAPPPLEQGASTASPLLPFFASSPLPPFLEPPSSPAEQTGPSPPSYQLLPPSPPPPGAATGAGPGFMQLASPGLGVLLLCVFL